MLTHRRSSVGPLAMSVVSIVALVLLLPAAAYAQAAITGVVKDTSGAVLPGVTVEAASPVLIEKVRSVVSDDTGQYRIVNLPPGTFSLTFSLPGFSTVKRDGIELTGTFVATVNGDLKVGALEETITVTGETPIVDVQSARVQTTVSKDILAAIPSSRTATGIQALIPGMNTNSDVGGASGATGGGAGNIHGGRGDDSNMQNDGLTTTWQGGSGGGGNNANVAGAQEIVVSTSGGLGESEKGGVTINLIPREGGNTFSGTMFYAGANGSMQGSNYTQALKDQGLSSPQEIISNYDINPMGGGRIVRDKLWFYSTLRIWGAENTVPGMFQNKNAGDPTKWTYEPDTSRPATSDNQNGTAIMRLTWQATPRNKVSIYWAEQWNLGATGFKGGSATSAPESIGKLWYRPSRVQQATWSSPMTSRVLLEAGFGTYEARYRQNGAPREDGTFHPLLFQATEQAGIIPGLTYRAPVRYHHNTIGTHTWRASLSYVTGAHNMKFGYFGGFLNPLQHYWWSHDDGIINYRFRNGVPNRITIQGTSPLPGTDRFIQYQRNGWPTAFYAQDQWTKGKLTLQGGVRYDHYVTNYPDQQVGGTLLIPVPISFPSRSTPGANWNDITPRMGVAYDLFGNGKTALKFNLGKYPNAVIVQDGDFDLNPLARITVSTTRSWTDTDKDYVADCDLGNPAKNGECAAMADQNFGKNVFSRNYDPALVTGWGTRPYQWDMGLSVQQEVLPRVSVNVGYYRRWFGNFYTTDNRKLAPSDFDPFSITIPTDSRLPDGGGGTLAGLYDLNPAKFGQVDDYRTSSNAFGNQVENWHGVDVGVSARLRSGITVQGGTSTGRRLTDNCEIRAKLPETGPVNPYCRVEEPFLTQIRGLATYTIPKIAVQMSGTWQSTPGSEQLANYDVPTALIRPSLGRDLSGGAANVTVDLVGPATLFGDRRNQLDLRVAKILRFGKTRAQVGFDFYNVTNTDVVTGYNNGYVPGGAWLTPTSILTARWAKFSAQFDF